VIRHWPASYHAPVTFQLACGPDGRAVLVDGDGVHDLERVSDRAFGSDPMEALARHRDLHAVAEGLAGTEPDTEFDVAKLGPPVPRPQKVFGIGLNYKDHAAESNNEIPDAPLIFTKFPSCLNGPAGDVIVWGPTTDWEAELVVVIGTGGRGIGGADAWDHIAGLTCGQDISERRTQRAGKPPQFSMGKSYDSFGPTGPAVVSVDSFDDPDDLEISCWVNDERKQHARTSLLIFSVPELVAFISGITTLVPGDMIFTGTPAGVGAAAGTFLSPGDVVRTTIEGIGTMTNNCVAPPG